MHYFMTKADFCFKFSGRQIKTLLKFTKISPVNKMFNLASNVKCLVKFYDKII